MSIIHAKTSGVANPSDPTKVGGGNWDDPHVYGQHALIPLATMELTMNGTDILSANSTSRASGFYLYSTGIIRFDVDVSDIALAAGMQLYYHGRAWWASMPAGDDLIYLGWGGTGQAEFNLVNSVGAPFNPAGWVRFGGTLYGMVGP